MITEVQVQRIITLLENILSSLSPRIDGDDVDLSIGYKSDDGFYICLSPNATEGGLKVTLFGNSTPTVLQFSIGKNPYFLREIHVDAGNVATDVSWFR